MTASNWCSSSADAERVEALGEGNDVFLQVGLFLAAEEVDLGSAHDDRLPMGHRT
jgi:hypothetical protein